MAELNYHHLRYFWVIAQEQSLTKAAQRLHVSQSALSIQLRQLEQRLGHALFDRAHRRLTLTEAGRIALAHANAVFRSGEELVNTLKRGRGSKRQVLRVGAVATLSRNFQAQFLEPLRSRANLEVVIRSATLRELLSQLRAHTVDVVLSNQAVPRDTDSDWFSHLLAEQSVSLVGHPTRRKKPFAFPKDLADTPIVLPGLQSEIRLAFDALLEQAAVAPVIVAEVDDMAMLRLFARDWGALALVPAVVVQDELRAGVLVERCVVPQIKERFYAITPSRKFPNLLVRELVEGMKSRRS